MSQANALERTPTVDGLVFEALFLNALRPAGAFAEELRGAGFDASVLHREYPLEVFSRCLDVAARRLAPERMPDGALRELGHKLVDGVFARPSLRLLGMTLPMFGPERYLTSAFCWSWLGAIGYEMRASRERTRRWRIELFGPDEIPAELLAGAVERGMERSGVQAQVAISELRTAAFTLSVCW